MRMPHSYLLDSPASAALSNATAPHLLSEKGDGLFFAPLPRVALNHLLTTDALNRSPCEGIQYVGLANIQAPPLLVCGRD